MIRLEMKNVNTILIEKQQKYRLYHQVKLITINILQMKKYYLLIKTIEDQGGKQIEALKVLNLSSDNRLCFRNNLLGRI